MSVIKEEIERLTRELEQKKEELNRAKELYRSDLVKLNGYYWVVTFSDSTPFMTAYKKYLRATSAETFEYDKPGPQGGCITEYVSASVVFQDRRQALAYIADTLANLLNQVVAEIKR